MKKLIFIAFVVLIFAGKAVAGWTSSPPSPVQAGVSYGMGANHSATATTVVVYIYKNGAQVAGGGNGAGSPTYITATTSYSSSDTGPQTISYRTEGWSNASGSFQMDSSSSAATTVQGNSAPSAWISGSTLLLVDQPGSWNFGADDANGNLSRWRFYASTNPNPQWSSTSGSSVSGSYSTSFSSPGTYTWNVDVEDGPGASGSDSINVTVEPIPATFSFSNLSHTYNGSMKTASVTATPAGATYSTNLSVGPDVGDYTVTATATGNYSGSGSETLTIVPAAVNFTFAGGPTFTYDGSTKSVSMTATPSGASYSTSGVWSASSVGDYTAVVTGIGNYSGSAPYSWSIESAAQTPVTFSFSNLNHTYDGSIKSASVTPSPAGATYDHSLTGGPGAGEYPVSATATGSYSGSDSATLKIAPASQSAVSISPSSQSIAAGNSIVFSASGGGVGGYQWGGSASGTDNPKEVQFSTVGNHVVTVQSPGDANHSASNVATATVAVTAASGTPPSLTYQPGERTRSIGQSSTFTVVATGTQPFSYQWRKDGSPIPGATSQSYVVSNIQYSDAGAYTVVVSNIAGSATSSPATLTVVAAFEPGVAFPLVAPLQAQVNEEITIGGTAYDDDGDLQSLTAKWNGGVAQTWSGLNASLVDRYTLIYATGTPGSDAVFSMEATDSRYAGGSGGPGFASRSTTTAIIGPNEPPTTSNPSAVPDSSLTSIDLTATGSDGDGNLAYILFYISYPPNHNGYELVGSVAASGSVDTQTFTWQPGSLIDGTYILKAVAEDAVGAVDGSGALTSFTIGSTSSPTVSVAAGQVPVGNDVPVSFADAPIGGSIGLYQYTAADIDPIATTGVTSEAGSTSFSTAGLTIGAVYHVRLFAGAPGSSTRLSSSGNFTIAENWTLTVINGIGGGTGLQTDPLHPRTITANAPSGNLVFAGWTFVGESRGLFGDTRAPATTFIIDHGDATVKANFSEATAPTIVVQPDSVVRRPGEPAAFRVVATGAPPPTFQWQKDGVDLPGATLPIFVLNSAVLGDAGAYTVVVTNSQGQVVSSAATLTIEENLSISASIGASPTWSAVAPGSTTLTWFTRNATSVSVIGQGINSNAPQGTEVISGLPAGRYTYTLIAEGATDTVERNATFSVVPVGTDDGQPLPPTGTAIVGAIAGDLAVSNRGTAGFTIPLLTVPGRSGLEPRLALAYDSAASNGPAGVGWLLSTGFPSSIARGRTILARDGYVHAMSLGEADRLYMDGKRLLKVSGGSTGNYWQAGNVYRTEVDDFTTITALGTAGSSAIDGFKMETKDGHTLWFGRTELPSDDDATHFLGKPSDRQVYAWKLKRIKDAVGNQIDFYYSVYTNSIGAYTGEHSLNLIEYTSNQSGVAASNQVRLSYIRNDEAGGRADVSKGFLGSRRIETRHRLAQVTMAVREEESWSDVRVYTLNYDQSPGTGLSRLRAITLSAKENTGGGWYSPPATTLTYENEEDAGVPLSPPKTAAVPQDWTGAAKEFPLLTVSGDFNGDGLTDRFINGKVYLSNGTGFDEGEDTWITGGPSHFVKAGDIDGDGLTDLIWMESDGATVRAARSTGTSFAGVPAFDLGVIAFDPSAFKDNPAAAASRLSVGDFNGDGRSDILIHRSAGANASVGLYVAISNGSGFSNPGKWGSIVDPNVDAFYSYIEGTYYGKWNRVPSISQIEPIVADFNGDGLDDYVYIRRDVSQNDGTTQIVNTTVTLCAGITSSGEGGSAGLNAAGLVWRENNVAHNDNGIGDTTLMKVWPGDCNGDGYKDLLVLCQYRQNQPEPKKWFLIPGTVGGLLWDNVIEDYMPLEDPITGIPNHNLDFQTNYNTSRYFYPGQNVQTSGMFLQDINGDGRADFIFGRDDTVGWLVKYGTADGFSPARTLWADSEVDMATTPFVGPEGEGGTSMEPIDLNGDGCMDWLVTCPEDGSTFIAMGRFPKIDLLEEVTNGLGAKTTVGYGSTTDTSIYTPGAEVTYPIREVRAGRQIVSEVWRDTGTSTTSHFSYQYSGDRLDLSGRGALGFHSFVTLDQQTKLFKYQFLAQSFPMTGLTHREETYRWLGGSNFNIISSHDNTVVFDRVANGGGSLWPFTSQAIEYRWEDGAKPFSAEGSGPSSRPEALFGITDRSDAHIIITAKSTFDGQSTEQLTLPNVTDYDPSDVAGSASGTLDTGAAFSGLPGDITDGNLTKLVTSFGDGFSETVKTEYEDGIDIPNTSYQTLTGRPKKIETEVTAPLASPHNIEHAPDKHFTYMTGTSLVTEEKVDADRDGSFGGALDVVTTYSRDALGRITATTLSGYNNPGPEGESVIGSFTEANVQHVGSYSLSSVPNPTEDFDSRFDLPTKLKNAAPYLHETTTQYHALFAVPVSVTDVNDVNVATSYDALGRTVGVTRSVDGESLTTATFYFADTSQPVSGPADWNGVASGSGITDVSGLTLTSAYKGVVATTVQPTVTTYYDRLHRPIRTIKSGFNDQQIYTDIAYNTLGQVIAVSLPYLSGGTKYWTKTDYDALGRVSTVTAPNGTVTTHTYMGRATEVSVDAPNLGGPGGVDTAAQVNTTLVDAKGRTVAVWNADNVPTFSAGTTTTVPSIAFTLDGFGRMLATTLKDQSQQITASYDALGRQIQLADPDKGTWNYVNNALGQVVKQTDANDAVTRSTFDRFGRPLGRQTIGGGATETASFHYYDLSTNPGLHLVDQANKGWVGAPQREEADTVGASGYDAPATVNVRYYDTKGHPEIELARIDDQWFETHTAYDNYGRIQHVRYYWRPPGFEQADLTAPYQWQDYGLTYAYDGNGGSSKSYLISLTDPSGRIWWDQPAYDHMDRVTSVRKGEALVTNRTYRPSDGVMNAISTGSVQNQSFNYDGLGNLVHRTGTGGAETLTYDNLNRLTNSTKQGATSYWPNGNIRKKSDVAGTLAPADFDYDSTHPHAVAEAWGYSMDYDDNGNLITRTKGAEIWSLDWTGFDKPRWMAKNSVGSEFHYNAARSRVMQLEFDAMSGGAPSHYIRKRLYGAGPTVEANYGWVTDPEPKWQLSNLRVYVSAADGTVGAREFQPLAAGGDTEKLYIYHHDHLGSVESITRFNSSGATLAADSDGNPGRFSEDAWGQRRNPFTWLGTPGTTGDNPSDDGGHNSLTPRGFTGHEMLDDLGLVHMNGRIYDPLLGRMLSADILVQFASDLQSYNRYSYVRNNPLTTTDPTGFEEPVWLPRHVETLKSAKTPEASAQLGAVQSQVTREAIAGAGDSALSTVSIPGSALFSGMMNPQGPPGSSNLVPLDQAITQSEVANELGSAMRQGPRDAITNATGVADNNPGRNGAELASDITMAVAGAIQAAPALIEAAGSAIKTGLRSEIKAAKSVAAEGTKNAELFAAYDQAVAEIGDGSTTTLFHGGNLNNGMVSSTRDLSTTTELSHAMAYAEKNGGKVFEFKVPTTELKQLLTTPLVGEMTDTLKGTTSVGKEFRFDASLSDQLEKWKKK